MLYKTPIKAKISVFVLPFAYKIKRYYECIRDMPFLTKRVGSEFPFFPLCLSGTDKDQTKLNLTFPKEKGQVRIQPVPLPDSLKPAVQFWEFNSLLLGTHRLSQ